MRCCNDGVGISRGGIDLSARARTIWSTPSIFEPTTGLLLTYNPTYTCTLVGAETRWTPALWTPAAARTTSRYPRRALLLGHDPYRTRRTSRSSPPRAAQAATGLRLAARRHENGPGAPTRHQHRLGHREWTFVPIPASDNPGYADYLPATRAVPEQPSIRHACPGPAPGPVPYPGAAALRARCTGRTGCRCGRACRRRRRPCRVRARPAGAGSRAPRPLYPAATRSRTPNPRPPPVQRNDDVRENLHRRTVRLAIFTIVCSVGIWRCSRSSPSSDSRTEGLQGRVHQRHPA